MKKSIIGILISIVALSSLQAEAIDDIKLSQGARILMTRKMLDNAESNCHASGGLNRITEIITLFEIRQLRFRGGLRERIIRVPGVEGAFLKEPVYLKCLEGSCFIDQLPDYVKVRAECNQFNATSTQFIAKKDLF